jgi:triosephosphate isomerase
MHSSQRTSLVAGNWKMNGSAGMAETLAGEIAAGVRADGPEVAVMPPFPYLERVAARVAGSAVALGAQDLSEYEMGAYTGEVSGAMLADVGARYVLVGHSERRSLLAESDQRVAAKFAAALEAGLSPVLCVGETREQRESGRTESVIAAQVDAAIARTGIDGLAGGVIAYEPVWAIGTGLVAEPPQAQAVHAFVRARLAEHDATIAGRIRILYGGSMKPDNAGELLACDDIDGGLIGGASLQADAFLAIVEAAA